MVTVSDNKPNDTVCVGILITLDGRRVRRYVGRDPAAAKAELSPAVGQGGYVEFWINGKFVGCEEYRDGGWFSRRALEHDPIFYGNSVV